MLHWLAGAKAPDGASGMSSNAHCKWEHRLIAFIDVDSTACMEPPETPAPVFAVRAFKHAIFGTPQTVQPKPRRHSNNERDRQRPNVPRPARPQLARPKSAGDAATLALKQTDTPEPMPSPTKGILMTPGTAAAKRKTVTFGEHVVDNEVKKSLENSRTGLPNDCPGKFPSPWVQPSEKPEQADATPNDRKRGRSKLTEELHKAREESAKRRGEVDSKLKDSNDQDNDDANYEEPASESGKYWKHEYDIYRANTTREVKKLVTKQKAAKSFAREKDMQCTELADQLRQEKKKVDRLERKTAELEAQLKALQAQMATDRRPSLTAADQPAASRLTAPRAAPVRTQSADAQAAAGKKAPDASAEVVQPEVVKTERSQSDSMQDQASRATRTRHRPGNLPTDIWTQNLASSSPATSHHPNAPAQTMRGGRAVTSGTNLTPLKSLSINANNKDRGAGRDAPQRSPTLESSVVSRATRLTAPTSDKPRDETRGDSLDLSMIPPPFSPEVPLEKETTTSREASKPPSRPLPQPPSSKRSDDPLSPLVPSAVSSPFVPDAQAQPASPETAKSRPSHARAQSKENVSPSRTAAVPKDTLQVPRQKEVSAGGSKRDKEGREVSAERIAAAKARLAARGRQVT